MNQWKFLGEGLKSNFDGSPWVIGVWREVPPATELCNGLNASNYIQDALSFVQGDILAEVECEGEVIHSEDKSTWQRMRVIRAWKWTKRESVSMAVFSARQSLAEFESKYSGDDRPRKAIEAAENWLNTEAAAARAWSAAAESAAESAWSAARAAAWSADSAVQQNIHTYIVEHLIPTMELIGKMEEEEDEDE